RLRRIPRPGRNSDTRRGVVTTRAMPDNNQDQLRKDFQRFKTLDFESFRQLAADPSLSPYQKIGFPDQYRQGLEEDIFRDILAKLPRLAEPGAVEADIGCGCSDLPHLLMDHARSLGKTIAMVDSEEMLGHLTG